MLQAMRKAGHSVAAKILFGLLLLSFAIWGMGPIFSGNRVLTAATAGDVKITTTEVETAYRRELQSIERQYGMNLTEQIAGQLGLKREVAQQMVMQSLYDQEAQKLGLRLGLDLVKQTIASQPVFRDEQGKFSPDRFQQLLRAVGMPESVYVNTLRGDLVRTLLMGATRAGAAAPDALSRRLYAYEHEKRVAEALLVRAADMQNVPAPTEEDLVKFHQDHSDRYMAPEFRALSYIAIDMEKLAGSVTVSEDDLRKAYDEAPGDYAEPEKRDIVQITTQDQALAQKIAEEAATRPFEEVAKAHDLMARPLAEVTKGGILAQLADVVFKLEPNIASEAVQSPMGWHVIVVTKTTPPAQRSFEEVKDQIATGLKTQRAQEQADELAKQLEDALASGAKIDEVAQQMSLPLTKIEAVSAFGLRPDDSEITDKPMLEDVVKTAFNVEQGQTSPVSPTAKGLFVVQVDGVTPSHVKPLEEVKTLVQAAWLEDKRAEMASAKASTLMEALGKGESVSGLERTTAIGRDGADRGQLDQTAVAGIFATKPGEVLTSKTQEGTWVIRVAEIKPAALEGVDLAPVRDSLKEQMANDLLEQYGAALRTGYGVTLNEAWLGQTASE